jgi:hypothetical protein
VGFVDVNPLEAESDVLSDPSTFRPADRRQRFGHEPVLAVT